MAKKPAKNETSDWQIMVDAAKRGLEEQGYSLTRVPGRGLSNVWTVERNGKAQSASIRTTRNRWIAFQPLENGTRWKTLDDVDLVVVASVVSPDSPTDVEVYIFQAADVRKRFEAAYAARKNAGQTIRDNFGMWVALDKDASDIPAGAGSGIAEASRAVATFSMASLTGQQNAGAAKAGTPASTAPASGAKDLSNIADVMAWTRQRVAEIAGVRVEAVKLDLKIEY